MDTIPPARSSQTRGWVRHGGVSCSGLRHFVRGPARRVERRPPCARFTNCGCREGLRGNPGPSCAPRQELRNCHSDAMRKLVHSVGMDTDLIGATEAAELLGVHVATINRLAAEHTIPTAAKLPRPHRSPHLSPRRHPRLRRSSATVQHERLH